MPRHTAKQGQPYFYETRPFLDPETLEPLTSLSKQNGRLIVDGVSTAFTPDSWSHNAGGGYKVGLTSAQLGTPRDLEIRFEHESYLPVWDTIRVLSPAKHDELRGSQAALTTANYTAPNNTAITAIKAKTDNLPAQPAATGDIAGAQGAIIQHGDNAWKTAVVPPPPSAITVADYAPGMSPAEQVLKHPEHKLKVTELGEVIPAANSAGTIQAVQGRGLTILPMSPIGRDYEGAILTLPDYAPGFTARVAAVSVGPPVTLILDRDPPSEIESGRFRIEYLREDAGEIGQPERVSDRVLRLKAGSDYPVDSLRGRLVLIGDGSGLNHSAIITGNTADEVTVDRDLPAEVAYYELSWLAEGLLTPAERASVAGAVWAFVIENGQTAAGLLRGIAATALAHAADLLPGRRARFRDLANTKDRIAADLDEQGNRTNITLDLD